MQTAPESRVVVDRANKIKTTTKAQYLPAYGLACAITVALHNGRPLACPHRVISGPSLPLFWALIVHITVYDVSMVASFAGRTRPVRLSLIHGLHFILPDRGIDSCIICVSCTAAARAKAVSTSQ